MRKKVLILIGDAGNGHRSAANALTSSFQRLYPEIEIETVDIFTFGNYRGVFYNSDKTTMVISQNRNAEIIANFVFRFLNTWLGYKYFRWISHYSLHKVAEEVLREKNPDLIISIHPVVSAMLNKMKEDPSFDTKSVTVITDLVTLIKGWGDTSADIVFGPTDESIDTLIKYGVEPSRIKAPLFPINPNMSNFHNKEITFSSLNLIPEKKTILLTGGGYGIESLKKVIADVLEKFKDIQLVLITGKNADFKKYLEDKYKDFDNVRILGFVNNMQDYINISDIVIGKPGPATILEFELFNKKAILTKKIGEQETGNITYAQKNPNFTYIGDDWGKLENAIKISLEKETQNASRRSFDECDQIVKEIVKLL